MTNKLLVILEGHIPTTDIIIRSLKQLPNIKIKVMTFATLSYAEIFSGEYKILFIRTCSYAWNGLVQQLIKSKTHFLYYIDDNFWEMKGNTPLALCYQDKQLVQTLNEFVTHAEYVVAGSPNLAEYIRKRYNPKTITIDAAFDFAILKGLHQQPKESCIKILYSGTLYRDADFKQVTGALKKIAEEYRKKISLHFHGFVPEELRQLDNVFCDTNFYPYEEYIKKVFQENYDIGIAPLIPTLSNLAKSNVKFREYSACLIAGVYADLEPYQRCVVSGQNGLLVEDDENTWYHGLKSLIDNKVLRDTIIKNASADILKSYSHDKISKDWQRILNKLPRNKPQKQHFFHPTIAKVRYLYSKLFYLPKRAFHYYRFHGFWYTAKKIQRYLAFYK